MLGLRWCQVELKQLRSLGLGWPILLLCGGGEGLQPALHTQTMEEDLAAGLQLGPNSSFVAGPGSRSRSSLEGRKRVSGVYRPPRPSSLPNAERSLTGRASPANADSRTSLSSLGAGARHSSASQHYHSRFQKVGEAHSEPTQPRQQPDRHP